MKNLNRSSEQINRAIGQLVKSADREIAKRYARTLNEIRAEIAKYYEKFEQDGVLTYEEMARYDRLNRLTRDLESLLKQNYQHVKDVVYRVLGESYRDGYYITAWAVEADTLSKLSYSAVKPETILKAIENPVSGLTLNDRLHKHRSEIVWKIRQEITEGLVQGETYGTMANRIKETLEGDTAKAMRVVRTEAHRIKESATLESVRHANSNGIVMMKKWVTMKDERVRPGTKYSRQSADHRMLDGVTIPVEEDFEGKLGKGPAPGQLGHPAEDINCRCFLTYTVEKVEKPNVEELENMTFEKWKKERLK